MTTTREKFRARRAARIFQGRHWKPTQIRRMAAIEPRTPSVINTILWDTVIAAKKCAAEKKFVEPHHVIVARMTAALKEGLI